MKKILATLSIIFCLAFAITGLGGCSGCSPTDETGNGEKTVNTITTLEGVWESEYGKTGEHEKIIIDGSSIKCYINKGLNNKDALEWVGIYIPFNDPVSEGTWIFNEDPLGYPVEQGIPDNPGTREFNYSNEKLSCRMDDALGNFRDITFTKVSD